MKSFLEELAEKLYQKHHNGLGELKIVFPNRRAGLFFRQYLATKIARPVWSPEVLSIEDFIKSMSSLQSADTLTLIFELFEVYKKVNPAEKQFERFYFWGEVLLKDFDDIDKYLVNPENLFINLRYQKELENFFDYLSPEQKAVIQAFWKSFGSSGSRHQKDFLRIWEVLLLIYKQFKQKLSGKNIGYDGMIFREVAENIQSGKIAFGDKQVIFAGFNALTLAEEKIIAWCYEKVGAQIYWDLDEHYMDDVNQEAGVFLRKYRRHKILGKSFPASLPAHFKDGSAKNITLTGVPLEVGQAKKLGELLQNVISNSEDFKPQHSVVVLPDEHMLFPVLHSTPEAVKEINVTMGYPLRNTSLYSLMEHLLELQQNAKEKEGEEVEFHHRNVLSLLRHPYILFYNVALANGHINAIESNNKVYISGSEIGKKEALYKIIFRKLGEVNEIFDYLMDVLLIINRHIKKEEDEHPVIEQEYIYHFYTHLKRLKQVIAGQKIILDLRTFLKLFRQMMQSLRLPFTGEPLNGLQVMGVLETRNLDFDHVYILSMNEGKFPAQGAQTSFIPYNLRKGFDLPTFDQQDATYAYHFYRLLQRAKNIHLLYNTESGLSGSGEMSRFIYQLMYETDFDIKRSILSNPVQVQPLIPITIEKDAEVMKDLSRYLIDEGNKRLTPSALNTYLDCRLRFYYKYVAQLYEPEEVKEEVDAMVFGNLLHHCMEILYKQFTFRKGDKLIEKADFKVLKDSLKSVVNVAFARHYDWPEGKAFEFIGRNIIVREIILKMAGKILKNDFQYAPFEVVGLEDEAYTLDYDILSRSEFKKVGLKGIIDRIDLKDDHIRVIDYKTGRDNKNIESIPSLFDRNDPKRNKAGMQTLFYGLLYTERYGKKYKVIPGLFNARELFGNDFDIRLKLRNSDKRNDYRWLDNVIPYLDEFKYELSSLLAEIFDPSVPFDQTDDFKKCGYCPYAGICHKMT